MSWQLAVVSVLSKHAAFQKWSGFGFAACSLSKFSILTAASCKYIQDHMELRNPFLGKLQPSRSALLGYLH